MSAIKLPVHAYRQGKDYDHLWGIRDSDGERICSQLPEADAKHIAIAINLHDELVAALTSRMREVVGHSLSCKCPHCELLERAKL